MYPSNFHFKQSFSRVIYSYLYKAFQWIFISYQSSHFQFYFKESFSHFQETAPQIFHTASNWLTLGEDFIQFLIISNFWMLLLGEHFTNSSFVIGMIHSEMSWVITTYIVISLVILS